MNRYLVLDLGSKRTGIALVDDHARVGTPLEVIHFEPLHKEFSKRIIELINEWEIKGIVFGLPIDRKGKEAIAAQNVREIATSISEMLNASQKSKGEAELEVYFVDERMSTAQSEKLMKGAGVSSKNRAELRDALAAAVIAQSFADTL